MRYTLKKTVYEIVESGNHYCMGLKANQRKLLDQAQQCAETQPPLSGHEEVDTSHGRVVNRRVQVFRAPAELSRDWRSLAAFVSVERSGVRQGRPFQRQSWFIISQTLPAESLAQMIQAHRGTTENKLHWVKDVVQGEDDSMIQSANPATLMALLRSWAISIFRKAGHPSLTKAIRGFRHDLPTLISFL
ncbi:MAG: ISAs1 family transposase [Elainellaceae cyanobacterium]